MKSLEKLINQYLTTLCNKYLIDINTIEYKGVPLEVSLKEHHLDVDIIFQAQLIGMTTGYPYLDDGVIETPFGYMPINKSEMTYEQLESHVSYFDGFNSPRIDGKLEDEMKCFILFSAVRQMFFNQGTLLVVPPPQYPVKIENNLIVNDKRAAIFNRFMNPSKKSYYQFAMEIKTHAKLEHEQTDIEVTHEI